jgi:phosphoribosylanthranilate isomerase
MVINFMRIKICGITQVNQAKAIADFGATALGFIAVASSPRYVNPRQIQEIIINLPEKIDKIGVFANAETDIIAKIVKDTGLTAVQLHGKETIDFCQKLRDILPDIEIIKALRIKDQDDLKLTEVYNNFVDTLLLDAYHPQMLGGTGKTLDWEILKDFQPSLPWFLAGGLTPDNIIDCLQQVQPDGIDLSSGVERSPGDKDLKLVDNLFQQLRKIILIDK